MKYETRTEYPFYNPEHIRLQAVELLAEVKAFIDGFDAESKSILNRYVDKSESELKALPEQEVRTAFFTHGQAQATLLNKLNQAYFYSKFEIERQERNKRLDEYLKERYAELNLFQNGLGI